MGNLCRGAVWQCVAAKMLWAAMSKCWHDMKGAIGMARTKQLWLTITTAKWPDDVANHTPCPDPHSNLLVGGTHGTVVESAGCQADEATDKPSNL